jgi:hypothetical protein
MTDATTTTQDVPTDVTAVPEIELLGQSGGGCCGGSACG